MMSKYGTFLINGAERVIVSQFVRSPGVYFRTKPQQPSLLETYLLVQLSQTEVLGLNWNQNVMIQFLQMLTN